MAPNMTTTTRLVLPVPTDVPTPNIISDFIPIMTQIMTAVDSKTVGYLEGTLAARPAAGIVNRIYHTTDTGGYFFDTGTSWAQLGGTRTTNQVHSFTTDDQTSPNSSAASLGSFPIYPDGSGEVPLLVGAIVFCESGSGTVFKVQTDHAAHGSMVDVPGLTTLTPATGACVFTGVTGGPSALSALDRVRLVLTSPGTARGWMAAIVTRHTA